MQDSSQFSESELSNNVLERDHGKTLTLVIYADLSVSLSALWSQLSQTLRCKYLIWRLENIVLICLIEYLVVVASDSKSKTFLIVYLYNDVSFSVIIY